ncbi:MAG TPA: site-specific integrase [Acidobacteriaceae bacterium]|nr:site-specific integrase [Acidobacteriaceae bacterium]
MTELRNRMIEKLRLKNYSLRTQQAYVAAVAHFARHFGRSPDELGAEQIRQWQVYLQGEKKASWSYFNQAMSALRFFYREILGRDELIPRLSFMRRERRLPVIPSIDEVGAFLEAIGNERYRMILTVIYACGLRLLEATHIEVRDIDSQRMLIHVRQGKGKKDRYVTLSPLLLEMLRAYWRQYRPKRLLFPAPDDPNKPLNPTTLQKHCQNVCLRAGIKKKVTPRTLRHAFATHLLEGGANIRVVQTLLGHGSVHTTEIYTHVSDEAIRNVVSPLDRLPRRR